MSSDTRRSIAARTFSQLRQIPKEVARAIPSSKQGETPGSLETYKTQLYTYFTEPNGETMLIYSADRWVTMRLTLQTAGPVDVGTAPNIGPVLSGKGRSLVTGVELETRLAKGTRIYLISETVNRVLVTIEPIPWMEQIARGIAGVAATISRTLAPADSFDPVAPTTSSSPRPPDPSCPPPKRFRRPPFKPNF